jgi:hypothetical protein
MRRQVGFPAPRRRANALLSADHHVADDLKEACRFWAARMDTTKPAFRYY